MKKIFLIIFLALLIFLPLISQAAGLVPCGGKGEPTCQLCHLFLMFQGVVNFLLKYILVPLAVLMLILGGFMYVFAYVNPSEVLFGRKGGPALISQAKKLIVSVIIGLIVLFLAWGAVNLIFQVLGVADWTRLKAGNWWTGNWWNVNKDCPTEPSQITNCTPATCDSLGKQCGIWYDNCGKYLTCPACGANQACNTLGQCVTGSDGDKQPPPVLPFALTCEGTCKSASGGCTGSYCRADLSGSCPPASLGDNRVCCVGMSCGNEEGPGTVLPWGLVSTDPESRVYFNAGQTKTFVARMTHNVGGFWTMYIPMTDFTVTCSFRLPLKPDGSYYQLAPQVLSNPNLQISEDSSGTLISGLWASYDGSIDFIIQAGDEVQILMSIRAISFSPVPQTKRVGDL